MQIIERIQGDPNEETREFLAGRINAMRRELGKPQTDFIRNKSSFARLVTAYGLELAEYERAVRFGTRMAEWWIVDLQVEHELDLIEIESRIERLANQAEMLVKFNNKKEKEMAKDKGKKDKGNSKKKDQKATETVAAEETMPEPEAEATPDPEATMTDRRAVEILFAVTMKEEDRPKVEVFTDTQCEAELKENIGLLAPEDRKTVLEQFPEDGEAAWDHFQALRADLAGEKAKEEKKAEKAAGKAKKDKAPAAEKPPKEKKTKEPKESKGPVDHSTSNKAQVYLAWKAGETDVEKLHKKINEGVSKGTIKAWIGQWKNGKNLPAVAKEKAA